MHAQKERLVRPDQRSRERGIHFTRINSTNYIGELQYVKNTSLEDD